MAQTNNSPMLNPSPEILPIFQATEI